MKTRYAVLLTLLFALAACSGGGRWHTHEAYSRPTPAGGTGVVYFLLHNATDHDDALLGASTDVAAVVEIHRSSTMPASGQPAEHEHAHGEGEHPHGDDEHPMSDAEMQEMMDVGGMQKVERLELAAGHEVEFSPGGYHLMLIGLTRELVAGDTFELTLHFEHAEDLTIQVRVLAP